MSAAATEYAGHILRVPEREVSRRPEREAWCFECRRRARFERVVKTPVDVFSYYGSRAQIECERGHVDGDCFPGTLREWSDD